MKSSQVIKIMYRTFYLLGVASLIASLALFLPLQRTTTPAVAQGRWSFNQFCGGFNLNAPAHPAITVIADFSPDGINWQDPQQWTEPPGGPATYTYNYNPQPPDGWEVRVRVLDDQGNELFNEKQFLIDCTTPTNTPVTPSNTPTTTTVTDTPTPTDTPTDTPTATATDTPTSTATFTPSVTPTVTDSPTPTDTPTATPTDTPSATPTDTPTHTPTSTGSITPTDTPTPTITGTISPTPTDTPTPTSTSTASSTPTATGTTTETVTPTDTATPTETATEATAESITNTPRPPTATNTPIPPPATPSGTQTTIIPVAGFDSSGQLPYLQSLFQNIGLGFLGVGLMLHGLHKRLKKAD